ncbi:MAG: hypothetical protein JRG97_12360 [Deltaproteobacteria bacterium]|nr:hypothetical protein [Deltaproteobacteria bacterium]MBW2052682.1 hypothetical protein [Deltaproteobacteria bacterium]MBW2141841.1 hypothetical protein [Deltaproteobacteria bacterium]MBW2323624.1 hypothetical protein [Deltaproteobacteria bacterium]
MPSLSIREYVSFRRVKITKQSVFTRSQAPAWERDYPEWIPKLELGNQRKGWVWPLNIIN